MRDADTGESVEFPLTPELQPGAGWHNYPMTVARRIARNFPAPLHGAELAFASTLPKAAGMSSSSALITACFLALSSVNDLAATEMYRENIRGAEDLADYLAALENGADYRGLPGGLGVGTRGGSQDHTAILCSRASELVQYTFGPVRFERAVAMPAGYRLAIAVSGVAAEKTGAAREMYNRAANQMRHVVEIWRDETGRTDASLGAALAADPRATDRLTDLVRAAAPEAAAELLTRVGQFVEESTEIVPAAGDALGRGDLTEFGRLVDRSQRLAETVLQNQVAETVALAGSARELGAEAASAFGAGFGGSVWALVADSGADDFILRWRAGYLARFPACSDTATFFTTRPAPPAVRLA
jgi:galactokinase